MLVSVGLRVPTNAIAYNDDVGVAHEDVSERQTPRGQPSRHRRKNCVSRNTPQTLACERLTRQPPTLDGGSTLLFGLVASGQIRLRRIDGYQHLADVLARGEVAA